METATENTPEEVTRVIGVCFFLNHASYFHLFDTLSHVPVSYNAAVASGVAL